MATAEWRNLPSDILISISKLFKTEIDLLRLRSVCSPWRSSLPLAPKPFSFPLKVPPLVTNSIFETLDGYFTLEQNTCYRVSRPDSSNGWIFKVSEINPNTFSLRLLLMTGKMEYPPGYKPKQLDLLKYRVSEICKSYSLHANFDIDIDKVIALWNYVPDCEFAVLVLGSGLLSFWRFGDDDWTPVDIKRYILEDLILYDGKCYAVDYTGALLCFDSEFNLTVVVASSERYSELIRNYLLKCESHLYMLSKIKGDNNYLRLRLKKYNKCKCNWDSVGDFGDKVLFLCDDDDASFAWVSPKDFGRCKGNRVYVTADFAFVGEEYDGCGSYHFKLESILNQQRLNYDECGKIFWLPSSYPYD